MMGLFYLLLGIVLANQSAQYMYGGDSSEFAAIAATWSIPHPPGYPLYSLLANCITSILPFGTLPWRASLLSVIPATLTAYLLYKIARRLNIRTFVALFSSLIYLILFPVWEYALVPEVFALNAFLVMTVTYLLINYRSTKNVHTLFLAAFVAGLCVAHHHTFILFIPGWVLLIKGRWRTLLKGLPFVFLGAAFYLYVPLAGSLHPPIQWEDGTTLNGFWRLFTRAAYGTFTAYAGAKWNITNQLYGVFSFFVLLFQDFRIVGVLFIMGGIYESIRRRAQKIFQFLNITSLVYIIFLFYTNFALTTAFTVAMYERFFILFYCILILYFALGYEAFAAHISEFVQTHSKKQIVRSFTSVCLTLIIVIYGSTVAASNWRTISYIKAMRDFDWLGRDIIATVPRGGIFFAGSDNANFTTQYHVFVTGKASHINFFQINFIGQKQYLTAFKKNHPNLAYPSSFTHKNSLEQFFLLNIKRGIYLDGPMPYGMWMPYGLLWKYYQTTEKALADLPIIIKENTILWTSIYHIPHITSAQKNILHLQTVQDLYIEAYVRYARLLFLGGKNKEAQAVLKDIISSYRPSNKDIKQTLINVQNCEKKPQTCLSPYGHE